eukprot:233877-Pelagomonas_calceolata.AAC.5
MMEPCPCSCRQTRLCCLLSCRGAAGAQGAAGAEGEGMYGKSPGDGGKAKKKPPKLKKHGR